MWACRKHEAVRVIEPTKQRRSIGSTAIFAVLLCLVGFVPGVIGCRSTVSASGARPEAVVTPDGRPNAAAFFRRPQASLVRISPDGQTIAGVSARDGLEFVFVRPALGGPIRAVARLERNVDRSSWRVRRLRWAGNGRLLISVEMPLEGQRAGQRRFRQSRLLVVDVATGDLRYIGVNWRNQQYMQYQDRIVSVPPDDPDHVLLGLWMPGGSGVSVQRVGLERGRLDAVVSPMHGSLAWFADHRGEVRAGRGEAKSYSEDFLVARASAEEPFEEILRFDPHTEPGFSFAGFSDDPNTLLVYRTSHAGRSGVYPVDLRTREIGPAVFAHPVADAGNVWTSDVDGRLIAVDYAVERPERRVYDPQLGNMLARIDAALPGRTNRVVGHDESEARFVIRSSGDIHPPMFHLFDRTTSRMRILFPAYPELVNARLAEMKPVRYAARDGLEIPGYLTLPVSGEAPHPLIVVPHGGPWSRDHWGWDPIVQFLASRGFAVLQPNFRGSDGYGRAFERRGHGRWGLEMQDDITDGVRWMIDRGLADEDRVGIYGISYGGYAALRAMQTEPELFRAAASYAGVTDILILLDDDDEAWGLLDDMEALVGDRWQDRERLADASPARGAEAIRGPVLIGHGTEDPRVHVRQADRMIRALERQGGVVESRIYDGEIHGFLDERNEIDWYARLAEFFERNLAPVEAKPDEVAPSS